ncbi:MAG: alcohol dehydrogenase catalytic domain-containing protein [Bacilli bacterium]|nr:alcohol dehydrogenase catalytic domain-containing protein [Bacilli bacterium]
MKCVAIKGPKELSPALITEPKSINGSVLIEVNKAGICGSDIHYWVMGQPQTLVMGHEFCGKVLDPGSRTDLKIGDRVTALPISPCGECEACKSGNPQYCPSTWNEAIGLSLTNPGAYAEKTTARADLVIKVPDNVTDEEGAMVEPTAVALHAVNLANIKPTDNVLVMGGGIIGQLSALIAKKKGAKFVALSEANTLRGEKAVLLGSADKYCNALDENFTQKVLENNPYGYDVVIDCCGNSACVSNALVTAKPNGTIILVGVSMENISIPSILAVTKEQKLFGAIAYTKEEFISCIDMISKKELDVAKYIDDVVSLEEVQHAFERLTSGTDNAIKILIDPKK